MIASILYAHLASVRFEHSVCRRSLMTTYVFVHICAYICVHIYLHPRIYMCFFLISQALLVVTTIASLEHLRDGTKGREPLKLLILQLLNIDFKENYKKNINFGSKDRLLGKITSRL